MKSVTWLLATILIVFGVTVNVFAFEGGTKIVATMTHPQNGETQFAPILLIPHDDLAPSKSVVQFLHRAPKPTLSVERIREEKLGKSFGTKAVVLFQRGK